MAMKRLPQVSAMAMMLALAACGNGGDGSGGGGGTTPPGGGGQTPSGSLPQGASFSSGSGVDSLSAESVTVNGTTYGNVSDDDTTGVRTYTASGAGTAAVVDEDMVMTSRVGEDTLGATLESGVYGVYATGVGGTAGATTRGFYGGVNTDTVPTTGTATYEGGALGIETTVDDTTGAETVESYTGTMSADADFGAGTVGVDLDYDGFGAISSTGGTFSGGALTGGTVTVTTATGDAAEGDYAEGSKTLSAQMVGSDGSEMVGEVAMTNADTDATATFAGAFGGTSDDIGGDGTPPIDTSTNGGAVPTGANRDVPFGGADGVDRPDLDTLTINVDNDNDGTADDTVALARNAVDNEGLLVYTTGGAALGSGASVDDTDVAYATRINDGTLTTSLDYTSFGVWSAEVDDDSDPNTADARQAGSFYNGDALPTGGFTPSTDPTPGTATYTGETLAIEVTNSGTTFTRLDGDMTATLDLAGGAGAIGVDLDFGNGNTLAFGALNLDDATGGFDADATTSSVTGAGNYSAITGFTGGTAIAGALLGETAANPEEIGGVYRANGGGRDLRGSFGGSNNSPTTP